MERAGDPRDTGWRLSGYAETQGTSQRGQAEENCQVRVQSVLCSSLRHLLPISHVKIGSRSGCHAGFKVGTLLAQPLRTVRLQVCTSTPDSSYCYFQQISSLWPTEASGQPVKSRERQGCQESCTPPWRPQLDKGRQLLLGPLSAALSISAPCSASPHPSPANAGSQADGVPLPDLGTQQPRVSCHLIETHRAPSDLPEG